MMIVGDVLQNSEKIILDLCGGTGSWSRPYKEAGYDVRIITLPDNYKFEENFSKRQVVRSMYPPAFANAFYEANL